MYFQLFSQDQRAAFVAAARALISVDPVNHDVESALLDHMSDTLVLPEPKHDPAHLRGLFQTRDSAIAVAFELLGIELVDGHYTAEEQAFMRDLGRALGLSEADLSEITEQVKVVIEVQNRLKTLSEREEEVA